MSAPPPAVVVVIEPGSTDHLEVRVFAAPMLPSEVVVGRFAISDPGEGDPHGGRVEVMLEPRDAELVASAIAEAARRALAAG